MKKKKQRKAIYEEAEKRSSASKSPARSCLRFNQHQRDETRGQLLYQRERSHTNREAREAPSGKGVRRRGKANTQKTDIMKLGRKHRSSSCSGLPGQPGLLLSAHDKLLSRQLHAGAAKLSRDGHRAHGCLESRRERGGRTAHGARQSL